MIRSAASGKLLELLHEVGEETDNTPSSALRRLEGFPSQAPPQASSIGKVMGRQAQTGVVETRSTFANRPLAAHSVIGPIAQVANGRETASVYETATTPALPMISLDMQHFERLLVSMEARARVRESKYTTLVQEVRIAQLSVSWS